MFPVHFAVVNGAGPITSGLAQVAVVIGSHPVPREIHTTSSWIVVGNELSAHEPRWSVT